MSSQAAVQVRYDFGMLGEREVRADGEPDVALTPTPGQRRLLGARARGPPARRPARDGGRGSGTNRVAATFRLSYPPYGLAIGEDVLWAAIRARGSPVYVC